MENRQLRRYCTRSLKLTQQDRLNEAKFEANYKSEVLVFFAKLKASYCWTPLAQRLARNWLLQLRKGETLRENTGLTGFGLLLSKKRGLNAYVSGVILETRARDWVGPARSRKCVTMPRQRNENVWYRLNFEIITSFWPDVASKAINMNYLTELLLLLKHTSF